MARIQVNTLENYDFSEVEFLFEKSDSDNAERPRETIEKMSNASKENKGIC